MILYLAAPGIWFGDLVVAQPIPKATLIARTYVGSTAVSSVLRIWKPGDVAHCRLCAPGQCSAHGDACMLLLKRWVKDDEAHRLDCSDVTWDPPTKK
jgi:hypothetical protein